MSDKSKFVSHAFCGSLDDLSCKYGVFLSFTQKVKVTVIANEWDVGIIVGERFLMRHILPFFCHKIQQGTI